MRKLKITEMGRMSVQEFHASTKMPLVVILDDVRSMYNVGSVLRTADAFRVESVCLCGITAQPPHPAIHKTALGAEDTVDWRHYPTAVEAVRDLVSQGYTVLGVEQCEGSTMLNQLTPAPDGRYAIILGNEVKGVSQEALDASHGCIEIPQYGTKHSLNVSSAAAIVIWHFAQVMMK